MKGIWFWPSDPKEQEKVLKDIRASEPILAALTALSKSKDGLSNAQLDIAIGSFSQWYTRWMIERLLSLGFVEYKVEWFGDPGKYVLTDLGREVLRRLTGQPPQPVVAAPVPVPKPAG
jgi:hypothetical protein